MKILVCGPELSRKEIIDGIPEGSQEVDLIEKWEDSIALGRYDGVFLLGNDKIHAETFISETPVFVNEVMATLEEIKASSNVIRINGWPGFLKRKVWEAAGNVNERARYAAAAIGKELISVKDTPGLVAATVVCMVINEAFFALQEGLSSKDEIDIAMKEATNYPYGPFEWGAKIGWQNVYGLLQKLSENDNKYTPSFVPDPK